MSILADDGLISSNSVYQITNSCCVKSGNYFSQALNSTAPTNGNYMTYSVWIKRGNIGTQQSIWSVYESGSTYSRSSGIRFNADNTIGFYEWRSDGGDFNVMATAAKFEDTSAWYNITVVANYVSGTVVKVYVNGVLQLNATGVGGYLYDWFLSGSDPTSGSFRLGYDQHESCYFDGYFSCVYFIDGQALLPTSFGQVDINGVWIPIKYTGTYGIKGYRLEFKNGAALGTDTSGNSNNWVSNGFTSSDQKTDTPTNNYATWNTLKSGNGNTFTYINGNLTSAFSASGNPPRISVTNMLFNIGVTSGYVEIYGNSFGGLYFGVGNSTETVASGEPLWITGGAVYYSVDGSCTVNGTRGAYGSTWSAGQTIGLAWKNGSVWFSINGVWQNSGNPSTNINPAATGLTGYKVIGISAPGSGYSYNVTLNCGQSSYAYTPPVGFKSLCTANLPSVSVKLPSQYFTTTLWTGNGTNGTTINTGIGADLIWTRGRTSGCNNILADTVRGITHNVWSDQVVAEDVYNSYGAISATTPTGFTVGTSGIILNYSGYNYATWSWKAGGAAVSNTNGSITSQVSANTSAGFSVVTYTGNNVVGATVGHGLNAVPQMILIKSRSNGVDWFVYHVGMGATAFMYLNQTAAATTTNGAWNNTAPTTTVLTMNASNYNNGSGYTNVAYCFAEVPGYSKFGSYYGNGSADGAFVNLGFRPRFVMIKRMDITGNWEIIDTARDTYNTCNHQSYANLTGNEGTNSDIDILANGFKCRSTNADVNGSGGTYIYAAFAENTFGGANVSPVTAR
jgi:hypothetical protein